MQRASNECWRCVWEVLTREGSKKHRRYFLMIQYKHDVIEITTCLLSSLDSPVESDEPPTTKSKLVASSLTLSFSILVPEKAHDRWVVLVLVAHLQTHVMWTEFPLPRCFCVFCCPDFPLDGQCGFTINGLHMNATIVLSWDHPPPDWVDKKLLLN